MKHFYFNFFRWRVCFSIGCYYRFSYRSLTKDDLRRSQRLQDFYDKVVNAPNPFDRLKTDSYD